MKTLNKYMLIMVCLFAASAVKGQKQNKVLSLDTSCIRSNYPAFGFQNLQDGHYLWMNRGTEEIDEENHLKFLSIDTIPVLEFKKLEAKYKSLLNSDSSLVEWTDTSFVIHKTHYTSDRRDYSEFNYYVGYISPLQLYCVSYISGKEEIGMLTFIDKLTGKTFYLESPSDYPLEAPSISNDGLFFSAYVNDYYDNYSFVSFFKIKKYGPKFCLEDYSGLKISNSKIDACIWVDSSALTILISNISSNGDAANQYCLRITIL